MSFTPELLQQASELLAAARAKGLKIATAESCTGGLIAGLLTEIAGSSDVFERGFVTYSNQAKMDLLDVPEELLKAHGAVSLEVAQAMAMGALRNSKAHIAVAVTGIAGPGGGTEDKPVGLVHIAACGRPELDFSADLCPITGFELRLGNIGRHAIRLATVETALQLIELNMRG